MRFSQRITILAFILLMQVSLMKLFAKNYPFTNADRDPFSPLVTKSGQIILKKTGVKSYVLKGIIYSDGSSIAVIGDELYKMNDHIGEYTIAKIGKKKVLLKRGKEIVVLKLEEK